MYAGKIYTWDHVSERHVSRNVHNQGLIEREFVGKRIVRVKMEANEKAIYA